MRNHTVAVLVNDPGFYTLRDSADGIGNRKTDAPGAGSVLYVVTILLPPRAILLCGKPRQALLNVFSDWLAIFPD
jgi:hypothetical protein